VRRGDDLVTHLAAVRLEKRDDDGDGGFDVVEFALVDAHALARQAGIREPDLDQVDGSALEGQFRGPHVGGHRVGLDDREGPAPAHLPLPEDRVVQLRVHVGEQQAIEDAVPAEPQALGQRLFHRRRGAADDRQVPATADRAALDERDRRFLQHRVGRVHADGNVAELDDCDRGVLFHHVILK
jgi:hypothetical protein